MELLSTQDVAKFLAIKPRTLRKYATLEDFPKPISKVGKTNAYSLEQIKEWQKNQNKPPTQTENGIPLVTLQEAAKHLKLSYGSLRTLITRNHDLPLKPHSYYRGHPIFELKTVEEWNEKRKRRRSHPTSKTASKVNGLLTRQGVAEMLNIKPESVTKYSLRSTLATKNFPLPKQKIGRTRLWDPKEIEKWKSNR